MLNKQRRSDEVTNQTRGNEMRERVFWNDGEKRDIAAHAYRLRQQKPDLSILAAVHQAQQATLAKNRRRDIDTAYAALGRNEKRRAIRRGGERGGVV
jgi:hypothetical protein